MSALLLLLLAGCGGEEPTPEALCIEDGGFACCADADCGADEVCHFSYTCYVQQGELRCSEPVGDRQCHQTCTEDGNLNECDAIGEACQVVEHVQGGDRIEDALICF